MRIYRQKPVVEFKDFLSLDSFADAMRAYNCTQEGTFFIAEVVKSQLKTKNRSSDEYKRAYRAFSSRLQALKKKGLVVNVRYGVWKFVNKGTPKSFSFIKIQDKMNAYYKQGMTWNEARVAAKQYFKQKNAVYVSNGVYKIEDLTKAS